MRIKLNLAILILLLIAEIANSQPVIIQRVNMNANNINAIFQNTGIFNQNTALQNRPGFEWPKLSGKHLIFSTGITIAAYVNDTLRMAAGSYRGEYGPGYIENLLPVSNSDFKIYNVYSYSTNADPDYVNWYKMVPYGAPYDDVNFNGQFDPMIDKPGVKNAAQTIFVVLNDANQSWHTTGEGFGGGTKPLYAQIGLTAWCYDSPGMEDIQLVKFNITNKSNFVWDSAFASIVCDPDIGDGNDDYIGCDTVTSSGFAYNADNNDPDYGSNPPAVGFTLLRGLRDFQTSPVKNLGLTSFVKFTNTGSAPPPCESDPNGEPVPAYNFMKGYKKDMSPWVNPLNNQPTKFVYTGNPESNVGWTQSKGSRQNCGGLNGNTINLDPPGDVRFVMSSGSTNLKIYPGQQQNIVIGEIAERGNSNLNSVTRVKMTAEFLRNYFELYIASNVNVNVNNISTNVPESFLVEQNYPNPFNPETKIRFSLPASGKVSLKVYDILGKEVSSIVDNNLAAGIFEYNFNGSALNSGVYFYKLEFIGTDGKYFSDMKKMMLVK